MADLEFVDPGTGAALGTHAFGTVSAGSTSASWAARLRYKWGQTGSGLNSNALVLEVSTDGGATWRTDLLEFTLQVTAVVNTSGDPLFAGGLTSARRVTRLELPALRAGCAYDLAIVFAPTLRTGAATTAYSWRLGVAYNESWREIGIVPGAPSGIITGLGDRTYSEWVAAPSLANGTDKVTLGACRYVCAGIRYKIDPGDVALSQADGSSATLSSGEEYIAVLSVGSAGTVTVTKGDLDTAGDALQPAYPAGELPLAVVRVPYGGVIVTSTLLAVSGRCLVSDTTGLVVSVGPGNAVSPGMLACPQTLQSVTCVDDTTNTVYLSEYGVANLTSGIPLATVITSGGDVSSVTDIRRLLRPEPIRLKLPGDETIADNIDRVYVPYAWTLDEMQILVMTPAAGATGNTTVDINAGGSGWTADPITAGTAAVVSDPAPPWNYGPGWISTDISGITTGGTRAADLEVLLWISPV